MGINEFIKRTLLKWVFILSKRTLPKMYRGAWCSHSHQKRANHTEYGTQAEAKRKSPAHKETITTQRASEKHLTLFNIYQEMRKWGPGTSERQSSRYLRKSKWDQHSSQHMPTFYFNMHRLQGIWRRTDNSIPQSDRGGLCMWRRAYVWQRSWQEESKNKNGKRKIIKKGQRWGKRWRGMQNYTNKLRRKYK